MSLQDYERFYDRFAGGSLAATLIIALIFGWICLFRWLLLLFF